MAVIVWEEASITVGVGETATVGFRYGMELEYMSPITTTDSGVATISTSGDPASFHGTATITGVAPGTTTSVPGSGDSQTEALSITVTSVDDESYLNKRGLTHFWENIDDIKQDKLTAGAGISITGNTISATGGGTADAVEWDNVLNKPTFSTVATSGSYNDLTNKPTIPTVNNATLTIQKNGTTVKTFTANASSNVTANITVPTKTSDLTNNSGFITDAGVTSFNGSTGAVTYTAPVTSVNGSTGAVTVTNLERAGLNVSPTSDIPSAWAAALPAGESWVWYNTASCFTNQPGRFGHLETIRDGGEVYQRWHGQSDGVTYYRAGDSIGWWGQSGGSGAFRKIIDSGQSATVTSNMIDWTTQTYTVTLGRHIESYSEVTVKSFGGIATIKGFLVTNAVVARGEALFTISNCPDALKNQRITTTGAAGIPYYYIDYDGKAFYDIGTVPVGNILFGVTFI